MRIVIRKESRAAADLLDRVIGQRLTYICRTVSRELKSDSVLGKDGLMQCVRSS